MSFGGTGTGPGSVSLTATPDRPLPGIASLQLTEDIVPGAHGSLLLAYVEVSWFPPRSAAEYLTAARVRLIRISADAAHFREVTTGSRRFISAITSALDRLPANPTVSFLCAPPPPGPVYQLVFVPAVGSQPAVIVHASECPHTTVTADGRSQPVLMDSGGTVAGLVAAFLRGVTRTGS